MMSARPTSGPTSTAWAARFYQLLTGQVPHPEDSAVEKMTGRVRTPPTPLRDLRPDVPARLAAVVDKMMARKRFAALPDACGRGRGAGSVAGRPVSMALVVVGGGHRVPGSPGGTGLAAVPQTRSGRRWSWKARCRTSRSWPRAPTSPFRPGSFVPARPSEFHRDRTGSLSRSRGLDLRLSRRKSTCPRPARQKSAWYARAPNPERSSQCPPWAPDLEAWSPGRPGRRSLPGPHQTGLSARAGSDWRCPPWNGGNLQQARDRNHVLNAALDFRCSFSCHSLAGSAGFACRGWFGQAERAFPVCRRSARGHHRRAGQSDHQDAQPRPPRETGRCVPAGLHAGRHARGDLRTLAGHVALGPLVVPHR